MTVIDCQNSCAIDPSIEATSIEKTSFIAKCITTLKALIVAARNRRAVEKLTSATDHELADMGLRRDDLYVIKKAGMFTDPSGELQRRARDYSRDWRNLL